MRNYEFTAILNDSITIAELEETLISNDNMIIDGFKVYGTVRASNHFMAICLAKTIVHDSVYLNSNN